MALRLHNTLSKRVEPFLPREPGRVGLYVCGPTVYDNAHIGHMRAALVFDVLRRYLEAGGLRVRHVQNITDVEDKIIAKAQAEGVSPEEITARYSAEYHQALAALNVLPPEIEPRATQHIPEMIEMIRGLIDGGYAYYAEGDVYFDVAKLPEYGKLSGRVLEELRVGARVEPGEFKRHPADFALWKRAKPGEPNWESPWGRGRPGWHIECSAMSLKYLGMGFDIHGGGDDLIFPHHENEIAQSEAYARSEPFARYWLHNAMVMVRGEKMSKSLQNYFTVSEALRRFPPEVVRLALVSVHYRKPIDFDLARFEEAAKALDRIRAAISSAAAVRAQAAPGHPGTPSQTLGAAAGEGAERFEAAMDDDLNTSGALGAIFDLVTAINRETDAVMKGTAAAETLRPGLDQAGDALQRMLGILGIHLAPPSEDVRVTERVRSLVATLRKDAGHLFSSEPGQSLDELMRYVLEGRQRARALKDFATADRIRTRLFEAGVHVEDLPTGSRWRVVGTDGRTS
ncbi:MAG TPA: cysteine--tRNA ligase [bacterium]|nr:cysteine--tRNA ligase [bacterium]